MKTQLTRTLLLSAALVMLSGCADLRLPWQQPEVVEPAEEEVPQPDVLEPAEQMTLMEAQIRLDEAGYVVGPIDGLMGPQTRTAIGHYQRDNGLEVTGELNEETINFLASPTPPPPDGE